MLVSITPKITSDYLSMTSLWKVIWVKLLLLQNKNLVWIHNDISRQNRYDEIIANVRHRKRSFQLALRPRPLSKDH